MNAPLLTSTELTPEEEQYLKSKGFIALSWQPISETHKNLLGSDGKHPWQTLNRMLLRYRATVEVTNLNE